MCVVRCLILEPQTILVLSNVVLYPKVARRPKVFNGVKICTVPGQAMSIKEMFRRFLRREALPVERPGEYIESEYDLEKVARLDRVEKDEIIAEMKVKNAKLKEQADAAVAKKAAADKAAKDAERAALLAELRQSDPKSSLPEA